MCGEKSIVAPSSGPCTGSPPRMRGKVLYRSGPDAGGRITPAYAGKSYTRTCYAYNVRDHPRVCGEKVGMGYRGKAPVGSPPRMRGKVYAHRSARVRCGITPAYAGKSTLYSGIRRVVLGSPPRMRGKVCQTCETQTGKRITPAYAGKSQCFRCCRQRPGDHPRVCGEKPGTNEGLGEHRGITPAYAGKSCSSCRPLQPPGDHPRVCGEKPQKPIPPAVLLGSPPRMRGKEGHPQGRPGRRGITPAYAGKSCPSTRPCTRSRDHPRVCGEKPCGATVMTRLMGSPPRMRGKGVDVTKPVYTPGITPAYAGKRLKRSHSIGHFSCILCLFHSVLHRASVSDGSRAGPCAPPCLPAQNAVPV